jgi:prepilin-type N-terminal cleavage/methylation domain-containing protein
MHYSQSSIINYQSSIRRAFTLVECLISLAISAMLLVAVAVAFNASIINYRENEEMFRTVNNARQALTRITTQLRTGHLVDPDAPPTRCSFFASTSTGDEDITYEFRDASYADPAFRNTLCLISNGNEYILCDHVVAAAFTKTPDGHGDCKSVQISLTVQSGGSQRSLAAAAVVRRNLEL